MPSHLDTALAAAIERAAAEAGLSVLSSEQGEDFHRRPTARFRLAASAGSESEHSLRLELSESFDWRSGKLLAEMASYLREQARRLRNPIPDASVTLAGLPVVFDNFRWPFHRSVSGADTYIVHGAVLLAGGTNSPLHAKVSASMTLTFAEIVAAPEQPFAESFVYNAVRKMLDQGQLEMLKSGNRQPVPVTTRYYSRWEKKFLFTDTDEAGRREYLRTKVYWLSGALGGCPPVWIADPRDAQYLNTTPAALMEAAAALAAAGQISIGGDGEFASASRAILEQGAEFHARLERALELTKPAFNEEMRAGHTNM